MEWHGDKFPLGTDITIPFLFFQKFAKKNGGVVLPPLFQGVDSCWYKENFPYYGVDFVNNNGEFEQKSGSIYYINNIVYNNIIESLLF